MPPEGPPSRPGEAVLRSLYLHLPFCRARCPYCDFNSRPGSAEERAQYLQALRAEVRTAAQQQGRPPVATVYLGGGTPTVYAPEELGDLLAEVRSAFAVTPDAEVTCEANPGTVDEPSLRVLRASGVNRLSLGVQSLCEQELRSLGRVHSAAEALAAIAAARAAGFTNLCADLMYGLSGQTVGDWLATLRAVVTLRPEHVSAYCLTIEEGTELARRVEAGLVTPLDEDTQAAQFGATHEVLGAAGYEHYEISNFALPGRRCRHNLTYWTGAEFVGLGAGAWSYVGGERWGNVRDVSEYVRRVATGEGPVAEREQLPPERAAAEAIMLGLRTADGVDLAEVAARFGVDAVHFGPAAERLVRDGLLRRDGTHLAPTEAGMRLGTDVALAFL